MTYPLFRWRAGSEVWAIFFDAENQRWLPKLAGYVERVEPQRILVSTPKGRAWESVTAGPKFPSEAAALEWCAENPWAAPGISERVSK